MLLRFPGESPPGLMRWTIVASTGRGKRPHFAETGVCLRGADAVITSGGVSAGAFEVVKTAVADIDLDQVPYTPVFNWLQAVGGVAEREMLRTFNCGIGMIVVVAAKDAKTVAASLKRSGETVVTLGTIRKRKGTEEQVALSGTLSVK